MSERVERFEIEERPHVAVRVPNADVRISRSTDGAVTVRLSGAERDLERFRIEKNGRHVVVEANRDRGVRFRWSGLDVEVRVPDDAEVEARVASGDVRSEPDLASLRVDTAAGDVQVDGAVTGDVALKSASGDLRAGRVGGRFDASVASGDVVVEGIEGDCKVNAASGDIRIGRLGGTGSFKCASGDLVVDRFEGDQFDAKSMSGDVTIGVPGGRTFDVAFRTLSGDVRTDFPVSGGKGGATARLQVTSLSGDITVQSAV